MEEEEESWIIPGLTDDVAALCLSRLPVLTLSCPFSGLPAMEDIPQERGTQRHKPGTIVYWEVFDSSGNKLGRIRDP
ncbi:hypothetical protein HID58_025655 [Brassica napus]|uniref:Uncharacterized protein n=1 Tax=Brassica napus TaxID=3708 RepID=A0ABQ8CNP7_BRANA|nr:hypothetical protein HID58_025655 [Brassica napus]